MGLLDLLVCLECGETRDRHPSSHTFELEEMMTKTKRPLPTIDYSEERHEYRVHGHIAESVTQVLPFSADGIPPDVLAKKAEFGKKVHAAIETYMDDISGVVDLFDPALRGYLSAWSKFTNETGLVWVYAYASEQIMVEFKMWHDLHCYAGRGDVLCYLPNILRADEP